MKVLIFFNGIDLLPPLTGINAKSFPSHFTFALNPFEKIILLFNAMKFL